MYCPKCGNKLQSGDLFCSKCGARQAGEVRFDWRGQEEKREREVVREGWNVGAVMGFCFSLSAWWIGFFGIVSLIGLILSCIGLYNLKRNNQKGLVLAVIGVVLGIVFTIQGIWNLFQLI